MKLDECLVTSPLTPQSYMYILFQSTPSAPVFHLNIHTDPKEPANIIITSL